MLTLRHMLDTMRVVAQRIYNRDSNGFEHRKRLGDGWFVTTDDIRRQRPYDVYSLLNQAPSVTVQYGNGFSRSVVMRAGAAFGMCVPELFVDGIRMPPDLISQIDMLVRPEEIAGMEIYQSGRAPAQFTSTRSTGCGAIV